MIVELLEAAAAAVHEWLAGPEPTLGLALGRLVLGLVLAVDALRMLRDHDLWYAADALRPVAPGRPQLPAVLDAFAWAERLGASSRGVLHVMLASALMFAAGLATAPSGVVLLLMLLAIPLRNTFVVYGGDGVARTFVLLLLVSPCGASLSLDRWLADGTLGLDAQAPPWGGRLVQLEVALLYLSNFLVKLPAAAWRRGEVMIDLLRNANFARPSVPAVLRRAAVGRLMTWGALGAELVLGPALLCSPTAAIACVAAIAFHLAIVRLIDVHLFGPVMVAGVLTCLPRSALQLVAPGLAVEPSAPPAASAGELAAMGAALVYVAYAIAWDWPGAGALHRWLRAALAPALDRIGWGRGFLMFTSSAPRTVEIELTTIDEHGELRRWIWAHPAALVPTARDAQRPWPGHRFQRFKFSLLQRPEARRRLAARFRAALEAAGIRAHAWSIDALLFDVHGDGSVVGGLGLAARVATTPAGPDRVAALRLARGVRCPSTRTKLRALARAPHEPQEMTP